MKNKNLNQFIRGKEKLSVSFTKDIYLIALATWLFNIPLVVSIAGLIITFSAPSINKIFKMPTVISDFRTEDISEYGNTIIYITPSLMLYFIIALIAGFLLGMIFYKRYKTMHIFKIIALLFALIITLSFAIFALLPIFITMIVLDGYFLGIHCWTLAKFSLFQFFIIFSLSFIIALLPLKKDI